MRICIVGCSGHFGHVVDDIAKGKEHVLLAYSTACEEDNMEKLELKLSSLGLSAKKYSDYKEMLNTERPDICVVDSAFYTHAVVAEYALSLGINTYCEKPVAFDLQELESLSKACNASTATFWAMQTARYNPWFYTANKLVKAGAVGKIRMLNGQKSYKPGIRPDFYKNRSTYGGTIPWVGIHSIDLINHLANEPVKTIYAQQSSVDNNNCGDLEMTGLINLSLANDIIASINIDFYRPNTAPTHGDDRIRVVGTKGVLEVRNSRIFLIDENGESEQEVQPSPGIWQSFVSACKGERQGKITAESSLYSTRIALLARQSADTNSVITVKDYE